MFFQLATGYAGVWYGVDPFDQPGVELGKQLTYAAMGRPGIQAADRGGSHARATRSERERDARPDAAPIV